MTGSSRQRAFSKSFPRLSPAVMLYAQKVQKRIKLFYIIEKSGTRHGTRRLWLIAIKSRQSVIARSESCKATSIIMCSAFRFFTLEQITSRLNTDDVLVRACPRALSARLNGSLSAACPWALSLKCKHIITLKNALLYSKKKNNKIFLDFAHLCNICTINLYNGADGLVQYQQL